MSTLPTSPGTFTVESVPTVAQLNDLAGMATFASQVPIIVSLKKNTAQNVPANSNAPVNWQVAEVNSDGMFTTGNPTQVVAQTQGYYKYNIAIAATVTSAADYVIQVLIFTGPNNPTPGVHSIISQNSSRSISSAADFMSLNASGLTPCMYPGDYLQVQFFCTTTTTITNAYLHSANTDLAGSGDGSSCLYMRWIGMGP